MPEISPGEGIFFGIIALIGGVIIGTQAPLWIQGILFVGVIVLLRSWLVRQLEIGALAYWTIGAAFIAGMVVGDISYVMQIGIQNVFNFDIPNPFKVR